MPYDHGKATEGSSWRERAVRELIEYSIDFAYLALFLGLFAWYRRLVLAEYHIHYLSYGVALVEALVLAKVIMIGNLLGLGRRIGKGPLIVHMLYRTVVFSIFVGLFAILEHILGGLLHGKTLAEALYAITAEDKYKLIARCLVTIFALVPFFAFQELTRMLGDGKLYALFFKSDQANCLRR